MSKGVTGIEIGIIELTSWSRTVTINHTLGSTPSYFIFYRPDIGNNAGVSIATDNIMVYRAEYGGTLTIATPTITKSTTSITFDSLSNRIFGTNYWIAIK